MKKLLVIFARVLMCALSLTLLSSCDDKDKNEKLITFHIGTSKKVAVGFSRSMVTMPLSGFSLVVTTDPFMYSGDLKRVDLAKVIMPDGSPLFGFYFDCNEKGLKKLYTQTASNTGSYVVMMYEGAPVGMREIDSPIDNGLLFIVPELPPDTDLQKKVDDMNLSIDTINKIIAEKEAAKMGIF